MLALSEHRHFTKPACHHQLPAQPHLKRHRQPQECTAAVLLSAQQPLSLRTYIRPVKASQGQGKCLTSTCYHNMFQLDFQWNHRQLISPTYQRATASRRQMAPRLAGRQHPELPASRLPSSWLMPGWAVCASVVANQIGIKRSSRGSLAVCMFSGPRAWPCIICGGRTTGLLRLGMAGQEGCFQHDGIGGPVHVQPLMMHHIRDSQLQHQNCG